MSIVFSEFISCRSTVPHLSAVELYTYSVACNDKPENYKAKQNTSKLLYIVKSIGNARVMFVMAEL